MTATVIMISIRWSSVRRMSCDAAVAHGQAHGSPAHGDPDQLERRPRRGSKRPCRTTPRMVVNATSAVPSLNRLSFSTIVVRRAGRAHLAEAGDHRDRVGGGQDRAQQQRHRPGQAEARAEDRPRHDDGDQHPGHREQRPPAPGSRAAGAGRSRWRPRTAGSAGRPACTTSGSRRDGRHEAATRPATTPASTSAML